MFSYQISLFFNRNYDKRLLNVVHPKLEVCTALQFLCVAVAGLTDTCKKKLRFVSNVPYLVALSSLMTALIEDIGLCNIILDSVLSLASSTMVWMTARCISCPFVSAVADTRLLPYNIDHGVVSPFASEENARVMSRAHKTRRPESVLERVPRVWHPPLWSSLSCPTAHLIFESCKTHLPASCPDKLVLVACVVASSDGEPKTGPTEPPWGTADDEAINGS